MECRRVAPGDSNGPPLVALCAKPSALPGSSGSPRDGRGLVYDRFGSVLSLPAGVGVQLLPLVHLGGGGSNGGGVLRYQLGGTTAAAAAAARAQTPSYVLRLLRRDEFGNKLRDRTIYDQYLDLFESLCRGPTAGRPHEDGPHHQGGFLLFAH